MFASFLPAAVGQLREAGEEAYGGQVITHYIVPNPPENVESILPIHFTEKSEPYRIF